MVQTGQPKRRRGVIPHATTHIVENWEFNDEPEHLRTIRDRLLKDLLRAIELLTLYRKVWQQEAVSTADTPEQIELFLSGLIVKQANSSKFITAFIPSFSTATGSIRPWLRYKSSSDYLT